MAIKRKAADAEDGRKSSKMKIGHLFVKAPAQNITQWKLNNVHGGDVYYIPEFVSSDTATQWYDNLNGLGVWYHPKLKVYGKEVSQSRSIAAYAMDESLVVKYSGHTVDLHHEYPPLLIQIQRTVEETLDERFNHVMLNKYESGQEYIGKHRDTKQNKVIASLSLGAERTFILIPNKGGESIRLRLKNGSLLIMMGDTQKNWKHEIPREPKVTDGRISLTFRQLCPT